MSDRINTQSQIAAFIAKQFNVELPSPETNLIETGILDSLSFVKLLLHLEQEFGVKINLVDLEIENFRSVANVAEFVADHRQAV